MIVKTQRPIKFLNPCECIVDEIELEKAILWYSDKPVSGTKKIFVYGKYPAVAIYKEKIHVHRLLMMYWLQRRLNSEEHVHHLDENKKNATRKNLDSVKGSEHLSLHNTGRKFSNEHREKISIAGKKRLGMKMKKRREIPLNELKNLLSEGWSINRISQHFSVDWSTIKNRIYENHELVKGNV